MNISRRQLKKMILSEIHNLLLEESPLLQPLDEKYPEIDADFIKEYSNKINSFKLDDANRLISPYQNDVLALNHIDAIFRKFSDYSDPGISYGIGHQIFWKAKKVNKRSGTNIPSLYYKFPNVTKFGAGEDGFHVGGTYNNRGKIRDKYANAIQEVLDDNFPALAALFRVNR